MSAPVAPLPGNVRLASTRDTCAGCSRLLNVNEPIYCGPNGTVICAACREAAPEPRPERDWYAPFRRVLADTPLSTLLVRAANRLSRDRDAPVGALAPATQDDHMMATELRNRARIIELQGTVWSEAQASGLRPVGGAQVLEVLALIGEVRS